MMQNRASAYVAVLLISVGVVFSVFNFVPGLSAGIVWPVVFYLCALGFALPPFIWPGSRTGLAGMLIPAAILLTLGLIFTYDVLTRDWASWGYTWTLLGAGTGLGLALAGWVGGWKGAVTWVGIWLMLGSMAVFALFASLFGTPALKLIGPICLLLAGIFILLRGARKEA